MENNGVMKRAVMHLDIGALVESLAYTALAQGRPMGDVRAVVGAALDTAQRRAALRLPKSTN